MSTTEAKEPTTRACPQCDGSGQESVGLRQCVCRKCKGAGTTAGTVKTSAVFDDAGAVDAPAGGLEGDKPSPADSEKDEFRQEDRNDDISREDSVEDVCGFLVSIVRSMNEAGLASMMEKTKAIVGEPASVPSDGIPNPHLAIRYVVATACRLAKEAKSGNAESADRLREIYYVAKMGGEV